MRKIFLGCVVALMVAGGFSAKAEGVVDSICLYIPNRILDTFDIFTLNVGFGPVARAELRFTRAVAFGGGIGFTAKAIKDYNRQYGAALQNGWNGSFLCIDAEDTSRKPTTRLVKEYWEHNEGFPSPEDRIYDFYTGARDYWEVGGSVGALGEVDFYIHPIEVLDLVAGFLFIDLKDDDLSFEDFE
ncbi:MAG: hypothetical protein WC071_03700 [Victivallaceae bacterium]